MNLEALKTAPQTRVAQHTDLAYHFFDEVLNRDFGAAMITDLSTPAHFGPFYFAESSLERSMQAEWCGLVVTLIRMVYGVEATTDTPLVDIFDAIVAAKMKRVH